MQAFNGTVEMDSPADPGWKRKIALFLGSQGLSLFGSMLVQYAIIWHVTLTTQSGWILTVATVSGFLPQIVISLFAGVWADRLPRKFLIIAADLLTAVSTLVLAVFFILGYRELWLIFLVSAIRSVGGGLQAPAVGALLPQIVPGDKLMRVNSLNGTIQPFIMIAAPILSGAVLALWRLEAVFLIDVVTAALAVGLLLALKVPPHAKAALEQTTGALEDLKAGLAYIRDSRSIRTLFIFFGVIFFLVAPAAFLTPLLIARNYGEEVWRLTANEVVFFAGSILGGVIMTAWGGFKNRFQTIGLSAIIWAGLFAGLGLSQSFPVYLALMFLSGLPMPFLNASTTTLLQEMVEPDMQGRIFGVQQLIMTTVMPLGMLVFGPIADILTVELLLILASGLMALPGVWVFISGKQPAVSAGIRPAALGAGSEFEAQTGD